MVYKETLIASLLSDVMTLIVLIAIIGSDIVFSLYVGHSFVIDIMAVVLFFCYLNSGMKRKEKIETKEELEKTLNELF